jgi:hypothetical protein
MRIGEGGCEQDAGAAALGRRWPLGGQHAEVLWREVLLLYLACGVGDWWLTCCSAQLGHGFPGAVEVGMKTERIWTDIGETIFVTIFFSNSESERIVCRYEYGIGVYR